LRTGFAISRAGATQRLSRSQPDEDFAAVQEMDEPESQAESYDTDHQLAEALGDVSIEELSDIAASEAERKFIEAANHFSD
jgi:hypothetical protein